MADLSGDDRGQIILIAAFLLALSFVVLALIVNSAIFTENLATRDDVAGSHDTLEYRAEIEANVGSLVETVNDNNSRALDGANDSIENVSQQGGFQQSAQGRVVNVSFEDRIDGIKIAQDNPNRNFSNNSPVGGSAPEDWTVAEDVGDIRNVKMNVSVNDLLGLSDAFTLVVNDSASNTRWTMEVADIGGATTDLEVRVTRPSGDVESCVRADVDGHVTIDVTGATVAGEPCQALDRRQSDGTEFWLGSGVSSPYDIEFENGANIEGTYSFIVDENANPQDVEPSADSNLPYQEDAIYSLDVSYAYYTRAVAYETTIVVAPGEVPP